MRRGYTLLELLTVLLVMGCAVNALLPAARSLTDRMAVVGAREALVGLVARARSEAFTHGGATLTILSDPPSAWIDAGDTVVTRSEIGSSFGVSLHLTGSRDWARLAFDALGLGRVASQTIRIRRGDASAGIVVSSYGRVRRLNP
ncbi:MAG: prepilin-type N-terminal cleavage/methylation domain-containing protein [Gemmatimonadetes bacterium]|nr:prepilin-type N-terminal cleavage/methylation domain-containing protein [Gemmatimonadota bacterium]